MQITLVSSGDTVSDVLDKFVSLFCVNESEINSFTDSQYLRLRSSIHELKEIVDFLLNKFTVDLTLPKRNSKVSLAGWIAEVLLSVREVSADQGIDSPSPEVEVLEPEKKPVYTISIIADGKISEERVSRLPPYLIDRKGNLLKKFWHRSCDAGYSEIVSKNLSNIAVDSGFVVKLMTEDLQVCQACICGDPPPFIVDRGGVYKRDRLKLNLAIRYAQVVSEYLSNIVVV